MFSNDNNIETIGKLIEVFKHYIGLKGEYYKFDITEKVVRLFTAIILLAVLFLIVILILIYLSFAAAYALSTSVGLTTAFLIVAGVYTFVLLLLIIFRKQWIELPLLRFLASVLIDKNASRNE